MRRNNLDNPFFIILISIFVLIVNTIAPIHFLYITLSGLVFSAFYVCLKNKYYYSLFVTILCFLYIELNSGLKIFSLSLLSFFMSIFVIPFIHRIINYQKLNMYIYISVFYIGIAILWSFISPLDTLIVASIVINLIIDFMLFGLLV